MSGRPIKRTLRERNVARDAESLARLRELEWKVLVIWECEVRLGSGFLKKATEYLDGQ